MKGLSEWLTGKQPVAAIVRRVALIALGALLAHVADLSGVPPEDRARLREALCSELFWSNPTLSGQRLSLPVSP